MNYNNETTEGYYTSCLCESIKKNGHIGFLLFCCCIRHSDAWLICEWFKIIAHLVYVSWISLVGVELKWKCLN